MTTHIPSALCRLRHRLFMLAFLFTSAFATAQTGWGADGSYYIYNMTSMSSQLFNQYLFSGDTLINDLPAKVVKVYRINYYGFEFPTRDPDQLLGELYMRNIGDSIYWWNESTFQFLYDLSPNSGDVWTIHANNAFECDEFPLPPSDELEVGEPGTLTILGQPYAIYQLSPSGYWIYGSRLFAGIGPSGSLFPQPGGSAVCGGIDEFSDFAERLICHYSPLTGTQKLTEINTPTDCEGLAVSVSDMSPPAIAARITLYPNPVTDGRLFLKTDLPTTGISFRIYDAMGKVVVDAQWQREIDLSNLPSGMYFIHFREDGLFFESQKIVK